MISLKQDKTESDSCDLSTALGEKENKYQKWMGELQNVQGWKRLPEVILSNDRSPRKMFIFSWLLKISKENPPPWQLNPVPHHLHKIFPDIQAHISCSSVSDRCLLSWLLVPIKWAWLHLVILLSLHIFEHLLMKSLTASSSPGWTVPDLSVIPYRRGVSSHHSVDLLDSLQSHLSCIREPWTGHSTPSEASSILREEEGWLPSTKTFLLLCKPLWITRIGTVKMRRGTLF